MGLKAGGYPSWRAMDQLLAGREAMISEEELLIDLVGYLDVKTDAMKEKRVLMATSDDDLVNEINRRRMLVTSQQDQLSAENIQDSEGENEMLSDEIIL